MKLTNRKNASIAPVLFSSVAVLVTFLVGQTVFATAFAAEGDIYKTTGDDGTTLFTDKPTGKSAVIVPIPIIAPVQGTACDGIGQQLLEFLSSEY